VEEEIKKLKALYRYLKAQGDTKLATLVKHIIRDLEEKIK